MKVYSACICVLLIKDFDSVEFILSFQNRIDIESGLFHEVHEKRYWYFDLIRNSFFSPDSENGVEMSLDLLQDQISFYVLLKWT